MDRLAKIDAQTDFMVMIGRDLAKSVHRNAENVQVRENRIALYGDFCFRKLRIKSINDLKNLLLKIILLSIYNI